MQGNETLQRLERGSYFGEVALMQNVLRSASCRAVTNCEISILHRLHLHEVSRTPRGGWREGEAGCMP